MGAIQVVHSVDKPVVISYRKSKGKGKWKRLCVLAADETARRASKYVLLVTGSRPTLYNLRNGEAERVTKDSKVGRKYLK